MDGVWHKSCVLGILHQLPDVNLQREDFAGRWGLDQLMGTLQHYAGTHGMRGTLPEQVPDAQVWSSGCSG